MSGSDMEKTESPTQKRRDDAREEGRVPRSQELNVAVMLVGAALVLKQTGAGIGESVVTLFGYGISLAAQGPMDAQGVATVAQRVGGRTLAAVTSFGGAMALISLGVAGAQGRGVLTAKPLGFNFRKLDPAANTKRLVGTQPWVELVKSLAKLALVGLVVRAALGAAWPESLALVQSDPLALLDVVERYGARLLLMAGGVYLALGVADYGYQVWQHEKGLMMSREEVRQEMKQGEVDPLVKQRMRSAARALARRQMFDEVPSADVVVTNPTHIAVALRYRQGRDLAPVVIAMGRGKIAERIKALAADARVPTVENRPVARALLAGAKVGSAIPEELYVAVIEIYAFVIRQRDAARRGR
jgi:flagellar biosynthetic protein FlhB